MTENTIPIIRIAKDHRSCGCCDAQNYKSRYPSPSGRLVEAIYEVKVGNLVSAMCPECLSVLGNNILILLGEAPNPQAKSKTKIEHDTELAQIVVQLARLWGEHEETWRGSIKGSFMKSFDRDELTVLMQRWANMFIEQHAVDEDLTLGIFFYNQITEFFLTHVRNLSAADNVNTGVD